MVMIVVITMIGLFLFLDDSIYSQSLKYRYLLVMSVLFMSVYSISAVIYVELSKKNEKESDKLFDVKSLRDEVKITKEDVPAVDGDSHISLASVVADMKKEGGESLQDEEKIIKEGVSVVDGDNPSLASVVADKGGADFRNIQTAFLKSEERLQKELNNIEHRAKVNLIMGSVIAFLGWIVLAWFVFDMSHNNLHGWLLMNSFLPRLTIVAFIELFSFFFLKLYRESMERILYYQNEITNIESKKIALLTSIVLESNCDQKEAIIESLLSTERNMVLRKGETTIGLEKVRLENSTAKSVIQTLKELGLTIVSGAK